MKSYIFLVELEEEDGVWSAVVPRLPGCAVDAGSPEDAIEALKEAAQAYVETLIEDGDDIPVEEIASGVLDGPALAVVVRSEDEQAFAPA